MLIKSLKLHNVRSYQSEIINFPEGSVMLSGDIGAGKSTILLAIEFALFGLRRKHLTGNSLLRKGENQGEIELKFVINKKEVIIKRVLKSGKSRVEQSAGYIIIDNVKQDLTPVELKAKVLELLGYPMDLLTKSKNLIYTYTVYTPQEEMKQIITEEPDVRLDVLRKVFGFNKYKTVRENCSIIIKEMRSKRKILESLTADLIEKKTYCDQLKLKQSLLVKQNVELKPKLLIVQQELEKKKVDINYLDKQKEELQNYKQNLAMNQVSLTEKKSVLENINKQIEQTKSEIQMLNLKVNNFVVTKPDSSLDEVSKLIKDKESLIFNVMKQEEVFKSKISIVDNTIKNIEKELQLLKIKSENVKNKKIELNALKNKLVPFEILNQKLNECNIKVKELEQQKSRFSVQKENAISSVNKVKNIENCPMCLQQVSHEHKQRISESEDNKIKACEIKLAKIEYELSFNYEQVKLFNAQIKELNEVQKKLSQIDFEIKFDLTELETLKDKQSLLDVHNKEKVELFKNLQLNSQIDIIEVKSYVETLKLLEKSWIQYQEVIKEKVNVEERLTKNKILLENQVKRCDEIKVMITQIESNISEHLIKINLLQNVEMNIKIAKESYNTLVITEKELLIRQASLDKEITGIGAQIGDVQKEIDKKELDMKKMYKIAQYQNWLEKSFIPMTVAIERQIFTHVYKLFNELFKTWFDMLIEDDLISVQLDQDFTPLIQQNGFDTDYEHLSGGEKTSVALAYRLALNKVVSDIYKGIATNDLIILDEPTDGFSREHLDKLRDVFDQLNMKQLIIVSHENKIESFVENIIKVVKNEHVSSVYS